MKNDVSNMVGCLQVTKIYSFMKEIKAYIRPPHIVFLFIKTEIINFIKEIKHVLRAFIAWWKPRLMFGRILDCVSDFPRSVLEFSQTFALVFTRLWRHREYVSFLKRNFKIPTEKFQIREQFERKGI